MKSGILAIIAVLLIASVFLQVTAQDVHVEKRNMKGAKVLEGTMIYSTSNTVHHLSVYGDTAAWTEWNSHDTNIKGWHSGSVVTYAATDATEEWPSVGTIVAWEAHENNSNVSKIMSSDGLIYQGTGEIGYPDVDESNVVFVADGKIMAKISGSVKTIDDLGRNDILPHISGENVVYANYIFSLNTNTKKLFYGSDFMTVGSDISGDWAIVYGRSNFGKSIYIYAMNINTGAAKSVWSADVGQYVTFDSINIDGNLIAWACDGTGYTYNLVTEQMTTYSVDHGTLDSLVVGGGKLLWGITNNGAYEIYMGDAPSATQSYVEVTLYNTGGHDSGICTLLIEDSQGNKLGYDANYHHYNEIQNAVIISEGGTYSYRLFGSGYHYNVISTDNGKYTLKIRHFGATRGDSMLQVNAENITIAKNEVHQYIVDWSKLASHISGAVQINIDSNGDGTFDKTVTSDSGNINEDTLNSGSSGNLGFLSSTMGLILIAIIILLVIVVVVLAVKKKK